MVQYLKIISTQFVTLLNVQLIFKFDVIKIKSRYNYYVQ